MITPAWPLLHTAWRTMHRTWSRQGPRISAMGYGKRRGDGITYSVAVFGSIGLRKVEIHEEDGLGKIEDGEDSHDIVSEEIDDTQESEHRPIRQPFGIVILRGRSDSLRRNTVLEGGGEGDTVP